MEIAVRAARLGNMLVSLIMGILITTMLAYGGYSLWDNYQLNHGAFLGSDLMKYKPVVSETGENLSLEELLLLNEDTRGWLTVDGTHIDYPVVQGADDLEYVNKDVMGEFSLSGAIFLSCLNRPDFSDSYNLLYGHHMDNGGMFGDVLKFTDAAYFESHKQGTLYLPHQTYGIELFACMEADAYDKLIYQPGENCDQAALLSYLKSDAVQYRDVGVKTGDQIVGFSTCVDAVTNGRVILFGRLKELQAQEGGADSYVSE